MKTLCLAAIGFGLLIQVLYLPMPQLSRTLAKYDYCYDTAMATKYDLTVPDFTEYGLKSTPECKQRQTHGYEVQKNGSARGQRNGNAETLRAYVLFFYAAFHGVLVSAFFFNVVQTTFIIK